MKSSFIKDLISVFSSRVAVIIFGIATSIVTARYLGPEGNGTIAALMIYPSLFLTIGSLGVRQSTTYFVGQSKYPISHIYSAALIIWSFTTIVSLVACYTLLKYTTKEEYSFSLIFLAIIAIPFSLFNTYSSGIFLGKQNIKDFNRINWIPAVINFGFTFLLIAVFPYGVAGSMLGTFLGVFILFFFVFNKIKKDINFKLAFNWPIIKGMLGLGITYALSLLIINLNYKADVILLERLSNNYELGIYSKGVSIIQYLWEIPMLISTLVFSRSAGAQDPNAFSLKVCKLLRIAGVVIFVASIGLYFFSDLIIGIMFGPKFKESGIILRILTPGVLLLTVFKILNMDLAGKGKPWIPMIAMIPAAIVNILLNILWIPKYGANGSALASTVSYTLAAVLFLWIYSKQTNIPISTILKITKEDVNDIMILYNKMKLKLKPKKAL